MSNMLNINCLVFGDDRQHIFPVEIAQTESVGALKDAIKTKNQHAFQQIDADTLDLWKISFPDDESLDKNLKNLNFDPDKQLSPTEELSEVFSETPPRKHLHLVVKLPMVVLNCFLLGNASHQTFHVEILKTKNIGMLKGLIKEKNPSSLGNVDAKNIDLWQVSFPIDDFPSKNPPTAGSKLTSERLLSDVFPSVLDIDRLHVIAGVSGQQPGQGAPSRTQADREKMDDFVTELINMRKRAVQNARNATKTRSVSEDTRAPPIQLFHPIFGHFLDDLSSDSDIPSEVLKATIDYMRAASAIYENEEVRRVKLRPHLRNIVDVKFVPKTNADNTSPYDVVQIQLEKVNQEMAITLLSVVKNEFGNASCNPPTQAGLSAVRYWTQKEHDGVRDISCCPTFLLMTAGSWFAILGFIFTSKWIVQPLTDFIWVGLDVASNEDHYRQVARIFYSLRSNVNKLGEYYAGLSKKDATPVHPTDLTHRCPSINTYRGEDHQVIQFTYVRPLESESTCVTFLARTTADNPKEVVIKFVQRYGEKAHRLLAAENLAPQLFYYGKIDQEGGPSYGHLRMVVMEYVDGTTLDEVNPTPPGLKDKLRHALKVLHDQRCVFGDFRLQNIIMTKDGGIKLIDFDWAGIDGKDKYPLMISPIIEWPAGVGALSIMKTSHDDDMLERLQLDEQ